MTGNVLFKRMSQILFTGSGRIAVRRVKKVDAKGKRILNDLFRMAYYINTHITL